ncbi:fibrinogen C domain-containing protein 1-A-like [Cochliomyia hominivorax]
MGITKVQMNTILILLNSIIFVKSLDAIQNNKVETTNIINDVKLFEDNPWNRTSEYELNIFKMEEKLKAMTEMFRRLEDKIIHMVNHKMVILQKHIQNMIEKIIEEKLTNIEQLMEDKIKNLMNENISIQTTLEDQIESLRKTLETKLDSLKQQYNLEELKCLHNISCQNLKVNNNRMPETYKTVYSSSNELKTLDGNWTVIQRRQDGSLNFNRNWTEYAEGFGDPNGEFFIGLNKLHNLTSLGNPQELYIMLEDYEGRKPFAKYGVFQIDSESNDFKLTVGEYSGDAGDSLEYSNGMKFSTIDRDNDLHKDESCAEMWQSGWWFKECYECNLNGQYFGQYSSEYVEEDLNVPTGEIFWISFGRYSLKYTQMMIRSKQN